MPHQRKFDHDEAKRRYANGETASGLAREYGVTVTAVWCVVSERGKTVQLRSRAVFYARNHVPCETCGNQTLGLIAGKKVGNPDGRILCRRCRSDEMRERLRFNEHGTLVSVRCVTSDCANGERWQPPGNFTRGKRHREVREGGIHSQCRACQTRARRERRHRNPEATLAYDREYRHRVRQRA